MRTMNCQNVRREIEAADRGDLLCVAAMEHIGLCTACEKFNDEHVKLRDIVSNLGSVKAPDDFEFRLRARIARANAQGTPTLNRLNFGFRRLAFASLMVVFGGSLLVVTLRSPEQAPVASNETPAASPVAAATPFQAPTGLPGVATLSPASNSTVDRVPVRRPRTTSKQIGRTGTRDMASAPARVVRPSEMTARASDFPIDTSAQPVRVSMDDGRGSSRTISVPRVSFGSQRVLSQSTSPLVASARGAW